MADEECGFACVALLPSFHTSAESTLPADAPLKARLAMTPMRTARIA